MDAMGAVYVPDVESVGSSRGFFLSGRTRSTTILATFGLVEQAEITMDVGDVRRAAQKISRRDATEEKHALGARDRRDGDDERQRGCDRGGRADGQERWGHYPCALAPPAPSQPPPGTVVALSRFGHGLIRLAGRLVFRPPIGPALLGERPPGHVIPWPGRDALPARSLTLPCKSSAASLEAFSDGRTPTHKHLRRMRAIHRTRAGACQTPSQRRPNQCTDIGPRS